MSNQVTVLNAEQIKYLEDKYETLWDACDRYPLLEDFLPKQAWDYPDLDDVFYMEDEVKTE